MTSVLLSGTVITVAAPLSDAFLTPFNFYNINVKLQIGTYGNLIVFHSLIHMT